MPAFLTPCSYESMTQANNQRPLSVSLVLASDGQTSIPELGPSAARPGNRPPSSCSLSMGRTLPPLTRPPLHLANQERCSVWESWFANHPAALPRFFFFFFLRSDQTSLPTYKCTAAVVATGCHGDMSLHRDCSPEHVTFVHWPIRIF